MINRSHPLPLTHQARLLDVSRSSLYYEPVGTSDGDLSLMAAIDEIHLALPFYGIRRLRDELVARGFAVGRDHVANLMCRMGIVPLWPRKKLSAPAPGHKIYPYLLRNLKIVRAGQVWSMDITYLPMARGFCYLTAVMDWTSRRVLAFRVSNTLDASFCIEALQEALERFPAPLMRASKALSLPPRASPACFSPTASRSAWTAAAAGWTTSSSRGCGAASNTRRSI